MSTDTVVLREIPAQSRRLAMAAAGVDLTWLAADLARPVFPSVDDVESVLSLIPGQRVGPGAVWGTGYAQVKAARRWRHETLWWSGQGTEDGKAFELSLSVGTVSLLLDDPARSERAIRRAAEQATARVALRAALIELEDWDALQALDAPGQGGEITEWSKKSRGRMVRAIAETDVSGLMREDSVPGMLTITLPGGWEVIAPDGKTFKKLVSRLRLRFWHEFGYALVGFWKLEFQRRGAPHLHLLAPVPAMAPDGELFEHWLSRMWAEVCDASRQCDRCGGVTVGVCGSGGCRRCSPSVLCCEAPTSEYSRHRGAGTGVDFTESARYSDPRRIAVYFLGHSSKTADGKEYQHVVPELWQRPGAGPGRFWGIWGLERAVRTVRVSGRDYVRARRVLRRLAGARAWRVAADSSGQAARALGPEAVRRARARAKGRPVKGLGASGGMLGGWVLCNDALAVGLALGVHLAGGRVGVFEARQGRMRELRARRAALIQARIEVSP